MEEKDLSFYAWLKSHEPQRNERKNQEPSISIKKAQDSNENPLNSYVENPIGEMDFTEDELKSAIAEFKKTQKYT